MTSAAMNRRLFLKVSGLAASAAAMAACAATPSAPAETETPSETEVQATATPAAEPGSTPSPAATAAQTSPARYSEAPMLAEMVAAGELPPVEERLPMEPLVQPVVEEIGQYGGIWHRAALSATSDTNIYRRLDSDGLLNSTTDGNSLEPAIAKRWETSADGTEHTFYLRQGLRWSDGEPFTADDILFWYESVVLNEDLSPVKPSWLQAGGELGRVEKVDDYTVKFIFSSSYGILPEWMPQVSKSTMLLPKHYLQQFHPDYRDQAEIESEAEEAGFEHWYQLFANRNDGYVNPDRPVLSAWRLVDNPEANPRIAERNPYYYRVDEAGQQLPYIDYIHHDVVTDMEVLNFQALAGELDYQARHINIMNYPLLMEGRENGGYRIVEYPNWGGADAALMCNQNFGQHDEATDQQKVLGDLIRAVEFRQALSIAIDRDEIWNSAFLELGEPRQMAPVRWSKYYEEGMETVWTEFDPDTANQMLDDLGLDQRDSDGYRVGPDGQTVQIILSAAPEFGPWVDTAQLVGTYWQEAVGLKTTVSIEERSLYYTRFAANQHLIDMWNTGGNGHVLVYPYWTMPYPGCQIAPLCGTWVESGGQAGIEPWDDLMRVKEVYDQAIITPDEAERDELAKEIFRINLANLWNIGTIGASPMVMGVTVVKDHFRNVPESGVCNEDAVHTPANCIPAQFFIRQS